MPRPLPKVRIEVSKFGSRSRLTLNGSELTNLVGYTVSHEAGRIQQITLTLQAEVELVTAEPPSPAPPAPEKG